jgi:hypothetical protein
MMAWPGPSLKPKRTAFKRAKKEHVWTEPWVVWRSDGYRDLVCPACRTRSVMNKLIDASPPFEPRKRYALYRCDACGSLHYPDAEPIAYEAQRDADLSRKYYLEIGAGLDSMLAPLAWVKHAAAAAYLEVGGGYGFSVDFAARALGWRADQQAAAPVPGHASRFAPRCAATEGADPRAARTGPDASFHRDQGLYGRHRGTDRDASPD